VNSFPKIIVTFLACIWLTFAGAGYAQTVNTPSLMSPEAQITSFYAWYLPATSQNGDPLRTNREKFSQFVAKELLAEIDKLIADDDLDADYFTQAQDYFEDWQKNITVTNVHTKANRATATLTLGITKKTKRRLLISLLKEGDHWKIRHVKRV
jgi:Protein of unknown function (DUF3828)